MREPPQPKRELTIIFASRVGSHILVRAATADSVVWLQQNAAMYGNLYQSTPGTWNLFVYAEYDVQEVAAWLASYNDFE